MRNISVMLTEQQVLDDHKTETRRQGARWARVGMRLCAIRKGQGLKAGEKIHRLCVLEVTAVRREPLNEIDEGGVVREGFPNMSPAEFVDFFCQHMGGEPEQDVAVISFRRLPTPDGLTVAEFVAQLDAEAKAANRKKPSAGKPARLRVRMSPSAGWVTCKADDDSWTHILDRNGVAWARGEDMPLSVYTAGRYVRPKIHGQQLDLIGDAP